MPSRSKEKVAAALRKIFKSGNDKVADVTDGNGNVAAAAVVANGGKTSNVVATVDSPGKRMRRQEIK